MHAIARFGDAVFYIAIYIDELSIENITVLHDQI